jgi:hypothetical protein
MHAIINESTEDFFLMLSTVTDEIIRFLETVFTLLGSMSEWLRLGLNIVFPLFQRNTAPFRKQYEFPASL